MFKNLRPRQAAESLGVSESTFWLRAKTDPDFPKLIKLTQRCTIVREQDLIDYIEKKSQQTPRAPIPAPAPGPAALEAVPA